MKRSLMLLLLALWAIPQVWAVSANLTTNGSSCPAAMNTTAIVVGLAEDKGGATLTIAGTWTGTISFYGTGSGSINNGGIWTALSVVPLGSSTAVTSTTSNGTWQVNVAGFTGICMLSSASMTGTATVTVTPSAASAKSNGVGGGSGTVTSIATSSPISGGTITTTGTISCPTCVTQSGGGAAGTPIACSTITAGSPPWGVCTITLTSAQILALKTPVTLIVAQGANTFIDVNFITADYVYNSTAYTLPGGFGNIEFFWGATDTTSNFVPTGFIDQTASQGARVASLLETYSGSVAPAPISDLANVALTVQNIGTSNYTLGNGTINLIIGYQIDTVH